MPSLRLPVLWFLLIIPALDAAVTVTVSDPEAARKAVRDAFRSPITLVNGIPDSPLNGYWQVKNTLIKGNSVLNCKHGFLLGYNDVKEATLPPIGTVLEGNHLAPRTGQPSPPAQEGIEITSVESRPQPDLKPFGTRW